MLFRAGGADRGLRDGARRPRPRDAGDRRRRLLRAPRGASTSSPTCGRSPTRSTTSRCSACSPRRSCGWDADALAELALRARERGAAAVGACSRREPPGRAGRAVRRALRGARARPRSRAAAGRRDRAPRSPSTATTAISPSCTRPSGGSRTSTSSSSSHATSRRARAATCARFARALARRARRLGARGRGAAAGRGHRGDPADDDPRREGARVPGRLRRRPRARHQTRASARCSPAPGRVGLRLPTAERERFDTLAYAALREQRRRAAAAEEERVVYVAMTRARERLILSGAARFASWPREPTAPIAWLGPALVADLAGARRGAAAATAVWGAGGVPLRLTLCAPDRADERARRARRPPAPAAPARRGRAGRRPADAARAEPRRSAARVARRTRPSCPTPRSPSTSAAPTATTCSASLGLADVDAPGGAGEGDGGARRGASTRCSRRSTSRAPPVDRGARAARWRSARAATRAGEGSPRWPARSRAARSARGWPARASCAARSRSRSCSAAGGACCAGSSTPAGSRPTARC